ncbi:MAG: aryl-sulfate sulfotransferase [Bacteroidetes bacterium]|nr:aryl-sulfate sulfotransferase [Bacteroidota bacterium]
MMHFFSRCRPARMVYTAILALATISQTDAQQTVGLILHDAGSFDGGYVLFAPIQSAQTYLIDKCGRLLHSWPSAYRPGQSCYLLADGSLLRPGNVGGADFDAGGRGGIIEKIAWDGTVIWSHALATDSAWQHHDVRALPNGNILAIAWERRTPAEVLAAGRKPTLIGTDFWSEKIVELAPSGSGDASVVWEWRLWDHLVQDNDSARANFGVVAQHPELMDLNYVGGGGSAANPDWIHLNAIDYNAELDQIVVSSHNMSEFWIIDHGTTTEQAASHTGGRRGHGGDLLYRWGNPATYRAGVPAARRLFGQHNVHWITAGPYAGDIMVFNNGQGGASDGYSTVNVVAPPQLADGSYRSTPGTAFEPTGFTWTYGDDTTARFSASNISGAQELPNGGVLICNGPAGTFFEIDSMKNIVWRYINPVGANGPVAQGTAPAQNLVFRCTLYPDNYGAFASRTLVPGAPLELNPLPSACSLAAAGVGERDEADELTIAPNPCIDRITLHTVTSGIREVSLWSVDGRSILRLNPEGRATDIDLPLPSHSPNGLYLVHVRTDHGITVRPLVVHGN